MRQHNTLLDNDIKISELLLALRNNYIKITELLVLAQRNKTGDSIPEGDQITYIMIFFF